MHWKLGPPPELPAISILAQVSHKVTCGSRPVRFPVGAWGSGECMLLWVTLEPLLQSIIAAGYRSCGMRLLVHACVRACVLICNYLKYGPGCLIFTTRPIRSISSMKGASSNVPSIEPRTPLGAYRFWTGRGRCHLCTKAPTCC